MSHTLEPPDGWLVPPVWLAEHALTEEESEALKARWLEVVKRGAPPVLLTPERFRWWDWPFVQWWWWRQYKRADRAAFRRECAAIRWRAAWRTGERSRTVGEVTNARPATTRSEKTAKGTR